MTASIQNQLLTQIEILRKSQPSEQPEGEGSRPPYLYSRWRKSLASRAIENMTGRSPRVTARQITQNTKGFKDLPSEGHIENHQEAG